MNKRSINPSDDRLSPADEALAAATREALQTQADSLSPQIMARLATARGQALAGQTRQKVVAVRRQWWPAGGLATAVAVGLAVVMLWPGKPLPAPSALGDMEILASAEGLDFYQDLEFYLWLAEQDDAG